MGQCPRMVKIVLHRLAQTLGKHTVFIHIDGGSDKFVYMAVMTDPSVNGLLAPTDDVIQLALQIEH